MSASTAPLSLVDFTACGLPTHKWMKLIRPRMRLRVRAERRDFVSPAIDVDGRVVRWAWRDDAFSRPLFADDEEFEVEIERRFLLRYTCIRRTKRMSLDQIRTGDDCALPLYDGGVSVEVLMLEDRTEMGEITFTLRGDVSSEDASHKGTIDVSTYSE